jgi:integrase
LKGNLPWKPYVDKLRQYNPAVRATAYWPYKQYLIILSEVLGYEDGIRGHKLRHSFAMRMLNHYGLSIQTVAEMLGDTIKTTSENYASYLDQTVQENYNEEIARHQEKLEKLEGKNKDKKKKG